MSGLEWTDAEHEAVEGVLRGYGFNATIQPLGKRLLAALAPHVEARVRQAKAEAVETERTADVAAIRARLEAAQAELDRMIDASTKEGGSPGYHWRWSIPANPERDSDLILSAPLADVAALLAENERLRGEVAGVSAALEVEYEGRCRAEAERDALAQRLARVAERAATKVYADDVSRLTAELEAAVERGDAAARERDEWKSRRDHAVEECRFLHQEGMSRRDHHLKHCGAARAAREAEAALEAERAKVARVEALRDSWLVEAARDECRCGGCDGCTARVMALDLRAALGGEEA